MLFTAFRHAALSGPAHIMKTPFPPLLPIFALLLASLSLSAHAAQACLIEGTYLKAGKPNAVKDCLEASGVSEAELKQTCEQITQTGAAIAQINGSPAPRMSYLPACPPNPEGRCRGFMGKAMTSYYYKRGPADLPNTKQSCLAQGGTWL